MSATALAATRWTLPVKSRAIAYAVNLLLFSSFRTSSAEHCAIRNPAFFVRDKALAAKAGFQLARAFGALGWNDGVKECTFRLEEVI